MLNSSFLTFNQHIRYLNLKVTAYIFKLFFFNNILLDYKIQQETAKKYVLFWKTLNKT